MEAQLISRVQSTQNARRRMPLGKIVGTLCAVGAAAGAYWYFCVALSVGSGPAGPSVSPAPFTQTWSDRKILLVGIGDGLTAGSGAANADHAYFARLVANPDDEFPDMRGLCLSAVLPNLTTLNLAVADTISHDHDQQISELPLQEADVQGLVVITTGAGELVNSFQDRPADEYAMYGVGLDAAQPWITNFEKRLDKLLDLIDGRFPGGCQIFLADIYDPTDGLGGSTSIWLPTWPDYLAVHAAYNDVIHRMANKRANVHSLPLHAAFLGHGVHCRQFWRRSYQADDPHYWFAENAREANDRGHDAIRRLFLNAIVARIATSE